MIRKYSIKRKKQIDEYHKDIRPAYLKLNPKCMVKDCNRKSTDIHHKKGRSGLLLLDVWWFLSTCRECHQYIEEHPTWAKENDYSMSRL